MPLTGPERRQIAADKRFAEESRFGPSNELVGILVRVHPGLRDELNRLASERGMTLNVMVAGLLLREVERAG